MKQLAINKILTSLIAVIDENNYILKNHHRNVTVIAYNLARAMAAPHSKDGKAYTSLLEEFKAIIQT